MIRQTGKFGGGMEKRVGWTLVNCGVVSGDIAVTIAKLFLP